MVWCKIIKENQGEPKLFLNVRRLLHIRFYTTFKKQFINWKDWKYTSLVFFLSVTVKIFIVTIHRIKNIRLKLPISELIFNPFYKYIIYINGLSFSLDVSLCHYWIYNVLHPFASYLDSLSCKNTLCSLGESRRSMDFLGWWPQHVCPCPVHCDIKSFFFL